MRYRLCFQAHLRGRCTVGDWDLGVYHWDLPQASVQFLEPPSCAFSLSLSLPLFLSLSLCVHNADVHVSGDVICDYRIRTNSSTWLRWVLVLFVWGILLPIIARWEWQLFFEEWKLPWEHEHPFQRLGRDCMEGA